MASREVMQAYVAKQYGGSWPQKVARMPDEQVTAIYYKMIERDEKLERDAQEVRGGEQLCLFRESGRLNEIKEEYLK